MLTSMDDIYCLLLFYVLLINMFVSTIIAQIDIYSETNFTWKWVNIATKLLLFITIQLQLRRFPSRNIPTK